MMNVFVFIIGGMSCLLVEVVVFIFVVKCVGKFVFFIMGMVIMFVEIVFVILDLDIDFIKFEVSIVIKLGFFIILFVVVCDIFMM